MKLIKGYEDKYIDVYKKWLDFLEKNNHIVDNALFEKEFQKEEYNFGEKTKIVFDGILDKNVWDKQKPKIIFLLRETYGKWYKISINKINPQIQPIVHNA